MLETYIQRQVFWKCKKNTECVINKTEKKKKLFLLLDTYSFPYFKRNASPLVDIHSASSPCLVHQYRLFLIFQLGGFACPQVSRYRHPSCLIKQEYPVSIPRMSLKLITRWHDSFYMLRLTLFISVTDELFEPQRIVKTTKFPMKSTWSLLKTICVHQSGFVRVSIIVKSN